MTAPKLKLWISPGACSIVPHILLNEANIPYELFVVDIVKEGGFPERYRTNGKKYVPILEVRDLDSKTSAPNNDPIIISELPAICTYIHRLAPEAHVMGASDLEFVRVLEWFNWLTGIVHHRGFGGLFNPRMFSADESAWPGIQKAARAHIEKCFAEIEGRLPGPGAAGGDGGAAAAFAVGSSITAVDAFLYAMWRWVHMLPGWDFSLYPKLKALVEGVVIKRRAVLATVEKEGIPLLDDNRGKPPGTEDGSGYAGY